MVKGHLTVCGLHKSKDFLFVFVFDTSFFVFVFKLCFVVLADREPPDVQASVSSTFSNLLLFVNASIETEPM